MESLVSYLGCGRFVIRNQRDLGDFTCTKFSDIYEKIIPFFNLYQIEGVKSLDFSDWCKVANLINNKAHLTKEGFKDIRKIKAGMNNGRIKNS